MGSTRQDRKRVQKLILLGVEARDRSRPFIATVGWRSPARWMTRDFFDFLAKEDDAKAYWLAPGSRQQANRKGPFSRSAKIAYNHAIAAIEHEGKGQEYSANIEWGAIYGSFP